ncbi:MAG: alpha-ketoglutarate-dependent dioxygenase AlkB [Chitinophagaceae bacterium]|nr:alpha-ketoglutarate-dependent dioxygenase AlkB [Oligoflexus sp.]
MDPHRLLERLQNSSPLRPPECWAQGDSWMIYQEQFWDKFGVIHLDNVMTWHQDQIRMFGRKIPLPRLTAWYGDPDARYVYSGISNEPKAWISELSDLRDVLEARLGIRFNSVLANRYADGSQHQGYHADDEKELGERPLIASLSFGAERRFLVKKKTRGSEELSQTKTLDLRNGSLLLMGGDFQKEYVHAIARTKKNCEMRINLTFRLIHIL